ncbi:MAG TPA: hypothetical protein VGC91_09255 [Pyrinomonadaceae bacterium]|jgi:hypothetical protein
MKYVLIVFLLCAPLLFSNTVAATRQQQENITISTSEGAAMKSLRTLFSAETAFQTKGGTGEYGDLKELRAAGLIDDELASGLKGGYSFIVKVKKSSLTTPPLIDLIARPSEYGKSGHRSFYLTESGVLLTSQAKDAPLSEMRPFANEATQTNANAPARNTPLAAEPSDEDDATGDVATNEARAIKTLQSIHSAETTFKDKYGAAEYGSLEQLEKQHLLDRARAAAMQNGYVFEIKLQAGKGDTPAAFTVSAVPQTYGVSGRRSFYIDQTGALRGDDKEGGPADAADPTIEQ